MRTFNYSEIKKQKWDSDVLSLIAAIYKEAGKQEMYLKQRPEELEKLVEIAKIQSTEASNAIEGIVKPLCMCRLYLSKRVCSYTLNFHKGDTLISLSKGATYPYRF